MMVHVALDFVRKPPQSYICYTFFTLSECWVVGWLLANTDNSTVFLFAGNLTANILAISIFLHSEILTWFRGICALVIMSTVMFILAILTLNFADMVTIVVCMIGGLLFGVFLLHKAFTLINNRYGHMLYKTDYIIGSLTIYVDFGFVLLLMLFIMLAMIKNFIS